MTFFDFTVLLGWYLLGVIPVSMYWYIRWRRGSNISYGDITLSAMLAALGPVALLIGAFAVTVSFIANFQWEKTAIRGRRQ